MKRFKYNNAIHKIALSAIVASFAGVVACDDVYWDREAYDGFIDTFGVKHPSQFDLNNNVCAYIARESMGIEKLNGSNWQNAIAEYHTQHPNDPIAPECLAQGDSNIAASAPDENGDSTDTQPSNSSENLALYKDTDFLKCLRAQIEIIQSRCDAVSVSKTGDENEGRMYIQVAEDITSKAQLDATIFACAQNDKNKDKNVCSDTATTQEHRNILNYRQCPNGYSLVVDGDKADRTYVCARTVCKSVAVHFETDMLNCGVCGNACDATENCSAGTCVPAECPKGQERCNNVCVNLASVHIADCNGDTITCNDGFKQCDENKVACNDLNQDIENCGTCGNRCKDGEACFRGECRINTCESQNETLCDINGDAQCKNIASDDADHCGACNYKCSSYPIPNATSNSCSAGQCQYECTDPYTNIADKADASGIQCVDFMTDSNHCGKKNNVCKDGNVCIGGHCKANPCTNPLETACLVGEENKCFNINATNKDHCGACNYKCSEHKVTNATSDVCKAGKCQYTCNTGFVNVGGGATADTIKCIDPRNDYNHCGKLDANTYEDCSKKPGTKCVDGVCTFNCPTGQQVCGTHCLNFTELNIDKCNNGTLVCLKDFENVDGKVENGCEVNLKTDSNNCGIKGKKCENGYCNNGTCQTTNCPQNELPCGENGACENVVNNVNHCGYCGNTCSGTTSVCSNRKCVECVDDGQCSGDKKRCNNLSGICQECLISDHCEIQNSLYVSCEVGSCNLIACKSGFHKSEDGKSCVEDSPEACGSTISDCTEIANSNEVACNAGNCEVKTCTGDNHVSADKKSCVQNSKEACGSATNDCTTIANSNEVACNEGNCEVKSCTGDNHVSADKKTCEVDTIHACGPKIDDCTKMITGNVVEAICQGGECKVSTCKEGYEVNGDQTECVEKATGGTDPGNGGEGSGADGGTGGTGTGDNGGTESP